MKHACPQCRKKFDYEKNGWMCPFCGEIILESTERQVQQAEQLEKEQQKIQKPLQTKTIQRKPAPKSVGSKLQSALICLLLIPIILLGICIGVGIPDLKERMQQQADAAAESDPVKQMQMQETIPVDCFTLQIKSASLFSMEQVQPPKGGKYLGVSYTSAGQSGESSILNIDNVAWAALREESTGLYLLPMHVSDMTGSEEIQLQLSWEQGVNIYLQSGTGQLIFLLPEDTALDENLTLCVFTGEEIIPRYGYDAVDITQVYEVPLTVSAETEVE